MKSYKLGVCLLIGALGACGDDADDPTADAGPDVADDATADATADAALDAGADTAADTGADTVADAPTDAPVDAAGGACAPATEAFGLTNAGAWTLIGDTARREPTYMAVSDCGVWMLSRNKSGDEEFKAFHSAGGADSLEQVESSFASDRLHTHAALGDALLAFTIEGPVLRATQGDPLTWETIASPEGASITRAVWFDDVTYVLVDSVSETDAWHQVATSDFASGTPTFDATTQLPGRIFELRRWGAGFLGHDRACVDGKIGSGEDGLECESDPAFASDLRVYHPHFAYSAGSDDLSAGTVHLASGGADQAVTLPFAVDTFPLVPGRGNDVRTAWVSDDWFAFVADDGAAEKIVVITGAGGGAAAVEVIDVPAHSIRGARATVADMWSDGEVLIVHVDNQNNTGNSEVYAMLLD